MGSKEDQLPELVEQARELVSTIRGLQKDLKADIKAARDLMDRDLSDRIHFAVEVRLIAMYEDLERLQVRNMRQMESNINQSLQNLRDAAFGKDRDAADYVKILRICKAAAESMDRVIPGSEEAILAEHMIGRMLTGVPPLEKKAKRS